MNTIEMIIPGSKILFDGKTYDVLGKTIYVSQQAPDTPYAKFLLEDHYVLVVSPSDGVAYFGKNEGRVVEFDGFPEVTNYKGQKFEKVAHDYQVVMQIIFGDPFAVEGEVEFWDYESGDSIISTAITSREKKRADVVAEYIDFDDIAII